MIPLSSLPQELYRSRPRNVRLSAAGRALAVVLALLCLGAPTVALLIHRQAVVEREHRDALLEAGVVTDGVVLRLKRESKENKRGTVYYRFDASGRTIEDRSRLPIARWNALTAGDTLPIRYLAEDPSISVPDGVIPSVMPAELAYLLASFLIALAALGGFAILHQRRLLGDGRAAMAVVKSVTKHRTQHGSYQKVLYEFPLMNGATQTGSATTGGAGPALGSSMVVLYHDERPGRSRPYPLSLVRVAESG